MKIYISGPITANPNGYKEAFATAAGIIREAGDEPVNPVDVQPGCLGECVREAEAYNEGGHTWACYMKYDLRLLLECDAVYVLPGWEVSDGARLEINVANNCGLQVIYEEEK
jgi:hypothetical protein